ncbi:hypothetical protein K432DRAFT_330209 [Lepidopterella palustris CBS 459.81]|uniref:BTB domain-containing protein n=1 Tax=Lepidopterella palustris CBS 459.81 TaxID=1314670 RepID=A0A8E2E8L3_9PEZI|nr:hypothetical protein K432DRAFT_330209 [Lepidopterella palustris CBS 459.81]
MMSEMKEKPLHELLSRSMVDIYVGTENTHWILHEKLLCHYSSFFRDIFYDSSRRESSSKSFGLPDEEDAPFRAFVGWLYSSSLPMPREEKDLGVLFDLYLMGEKWRIDALVRDVLHIVREWYRLSDTYPGLRRVQYIYANTEEDSAMRQMLVHSVARLLVLKDGIPAHWDKALRKNGQLAVDIIKAIQDWRLEEDMVPDAREEPGEEEEGEGEEGEEDAFPEIEPEEEAEKEEVQIKREAGEEFEAEKKKDEKLTNGLMKEIPNGVNGEAH